MPEGKLKLLIIEDDPNLAGMLNTYFSMEGYDVVSAYRGEEGTQACQVKPPGLIILDIHLPDIDGYEVARRIRSNLRTAAIPIIFLTTKSEHADRVQGLELGADDYITKPFDVQELRLRVRNAFRRSTQDTLTNPVTGLPEGLLVDEHLNKCLKEPDWAILITSLGNLDPFREIYGFVASDDVLRAICLMLENVTRDQGSGITFLGHLSPTEFILITTLQSAWPLFHRLGKRFVNSLDYFYPIKDREKAILLGKRLEIKTGILLSTNAVHYSLESLKQAVHQTIP
jgi:DNA-binding response OmpR family regulator